MPAVPNTVVGAPGVVAGTAAELADEALPVPAAFVAVTVNVYEVPFVKPVNVQERFNVFVQPAGAVTDGVDVTV